MTPMVVTEPTPDVAATPAGDAVAFAAVVTDPTAVVPLTPVVICVIAFATI